MKINNRNGFTLVELLSVIVILSLLALLTSNVITKVLSDAKDELSDTQMQLIKATTETWMSNNINKIPKAGSCKYLSLGDLKNEGLLDDDVFDLKNNQKLLDDIKIKVSTTLSKNGDLVKNIEVNSIDIEECKAFFTYYEGTNVITMENPNPGKLDNFKIYGSSVDLSSEYQQVEYIESTGTQYILTNIIPDDTTGAMLDFEVTNTSGDTLFFGSRSVSTGRYWDGQKNSFLYFGWNSFVTADVKRPVVEINKRMYTQKNYLNNRQEILNGQTIGRITTTLVNNTKPIVIFAGNDNGTIRYFSKIKLYNFKVTKASNIIANFIPCYRKEDKKVGLYDVINHIFYTNSGTGKFSKGSEIGGILVTDITDNNYGKYKIPVKVNDNVINIYIDEPLRKVGDVSDYIDYKNNRIVRNIAKIESYNGEEITGEYTSTTGSLDIGATIYFVLGKTLYEEIELPDIIIEDENTTIIVEGVSKLEIIN